MKKLLICLLAVCFAAACNAKPVAKETAKNTKQNQKAVVAYFSATGNTRNVAKNLAKAINADIYEIKPAVSYTSDDLNWRNKQSRSSIEMSDKTARPEIVKDGFSVKDYDTVYLGFPIWWGTAPRIIYTFLDSQDFAGKTIIIFATSGSSSIGNTDKDLKPSISTSAKIIKGKTLNGNPPIEELKKWADSLK